MYVCRQCRSDFRYIDKNIYSKCGVPFNSLDDTARDQLCGLCIRNFYTFQQARSVMLYDGKVKDLLRDFKYGGKLFIASVLADIVCKKVSGYFDDIDVVIPVPLHVNRLRDRGYNQSVAFCNAISKSMELENGLFIMKKTKDTKPQVEIKSFEDRRENVKGVYSVEDPSAIKDKRAMVVDDVFTSGSTVEECSRELLSAGAKSVKVLTIARSVYK